eukprot:1165128-Prymnesium_polylepis.1
MPVLRWRPKNSASTGVELRSVRTVFFFASSSSSSSRLVDHVCVLRVYGAADACVLRVDGAWHADGAR